MLLKTLKLNNFRQYKGEQSISFATDPTRNVTLIMGEGDSGKTTLAQAFTWCLYGDTDFEDKSMLCKTVALNMLPGTEVTVRVDLSLVHNGIGYVIIREQLYSKDSVGNMKRPGQTVFKIEYKNTDGQSDFMYNLDADIRMKEILPRELSKYFFFDGERIGNMSKEIRRGKSQEFAQAVRSLLGLNAFTAAIEHLKGKTSKLSVLRSYDESYDGGNDGKVAQYSKDIKRYDEEIENIDKRLEEIDNEQVIASEKCAELNEKIIINAESEQLAHDKIRLIKKRDGLISLKATSATAMLKAFNNLGPSYFSIRLMKDALEQLSRADKLDKGIPDVHQRTIEFLINRGKCLCDNEIKIGNEAYKALVKVLDYIPPQSIGTLIGQFIRDCELKSKNGENLFQDISEKYSIIRDFENDYAEILQDIARIEEKLEGLENVGSLQRELSKYEHALATLSEERDTLNRSKGSKETSRERCKTERNELTLKDENNRKIEVYKAYAQYMYDTLLEQYQIQESQTKANLERTVNEIFQSIFAGDFSIQIDEKYNIQVIVNDSNGYIGDVETGTSKSISVIFAFIAGVIKMARQDQNSENEMLVSESYPLVMDAPLSAFDKKRIKTVCDTLPNIAEQVIILIKDTDGELAEEYMGNKVGIRYQLNKKNAFETIFE